MKLTLTNIGSLGPGEVVFEFVPGLNAIVGVNGSGKSSCVNALYFALTGETINGDTFDDLITWGCTTAKVDLDCGGFSITRALKLGGAAKSTLVVGGQTLTRKREIDQAICNMFGFVDLSVFKLVFFAEQYRAIDVIDGTDSQRVAMLSALFGFARLEKIRASILQHANMLDTSLIGDDVMKSINDALASATADRDAQNVEYSRLQSLIMSPECIAECNAVIAAPLAGTIASLNAAYSDTSKMIEDYEKQLSELPQPPSAEQTALYQSYLKRESLKSQLSEKKERYDQLVASVGLQPGSIQGFLSQLETNRNSIIIQKQRLHERASLVESGKCPLTQGVPCPDLLALTDRSIIASQLAELDKSLAELDRDKEEMSKALREAQQLEAALTAAGKDVLVLTAQIAEVEIPEDFDPAEYQKALDSIDSSKLSRLTKLVATTKAQLLTIQSELDKYADCVERTAEEKSEAESKLAQHTIASSQLPVVAGNIQAAEKRVSEQLQSLQFAETQNESAKVAIKKKESLDKVRMALHKDNLPRLLIEDILENLNLLMEQELSEFSFPYTVRWCSNGALVYSEATGEPHPVRKLSGGQKYVVVLAMRCAFKRLLNTSFPFFVLDEPTTGLDVQNREYLSQSLNKLRDKYQDLVMVIPTHDQMLLPESNVITL